MTTSHLSGPLVVSGAFSTPSTNSSAGPSALYHGWGLTDSRYPYGPGMTGAGQVKAFMTAQLMVTTDAVPKAPLATMIVAAQTTPVVPVGGTLALPLQTTLASGRAISVPILPFGAGAQSSSVVTPGIMLEPGHTVGTTTAASTTITAVGDTGLLPAGSWIAVVGGATGGILPQIVQVTARTATTLTVTPAVAASASGAALIPCDKTGIGAVHYLQTGSVSIYDPYGGVARGVSVTTTAADTTFSVLVSGYDAFNVPMSELIACGSTTTVNGKKAFKSIVSATLTKVGGGTMAGNVSVGTSDLIGLNLRGEAWEYLTVFFNGVLVTSNTGFVAALAAGTASTTTTADVRGTYAPGTTDGTKRLVIYAQLSPRQTISATPADTSRMTGQTQA